MPNTKHILRYHVKAMAALHDRKGIQQSKLPKWDFNFPEMNARLYLTDRVKRKTGVRLHAGLDITTILTVDYTNDINNLANSVVEALIDLLSFTSSAHCETARIESHITINDDGTSVGDFFSYPYAGADIIIGTPRTIDRSAFEAIWEAYDRSQDKDRVRRSVAWFRKSLREKHTIDQFISLWIALEVVKPILRRRLKKKIGKTEEWDGMRDVFQNKIRAIDFDDVKEVRKQLLHGYREISQDFIERVRSYIEPTRKAVIYGICSVLDVGDEIADKIANNTPRRLFADPSLELRGNFENLPDNIDKLFRRYPEMIGKLKKQRYILHETGKLDFKFEISHRARLPKNTKFNADRMRLSGEGDSGIDTVQGELHD